MKRIPAILIGAGLVALATGLTLPLVTGQEKETKTGNDIDLVLCLDVSNSMDGLIEAAKNKLWDIVNDLAKVKPTPNLRVALYSYGNTGYPREAGWVRKELDFGTDLDMVFKKLFELRTRGGTEYVARVCRDAIRDQKWSTEKNALKLIFVCGNEPASQDRTISLKEVADLALAKDIIINPIYCGNADDSDARDWRELSTLAHGKFANIDHNQRIAAINTPFDKELAELGLKLNETYVHFGKEGKAKALNQHAQTENSRKLGVSNAAARASAQNSAFYKQSSWDLVDRLKEEPKLDITKIPESDLSEELRKLSPADRVKHVQDMTSKRETIQQRITELTNQRGVFIRDEMKKQNNQSKNAFGEALRSTIREQARPKGIIVPE